MREMIAAGLLAAALASGCTAAQSLGSTVAKVTLKDGTTIEWNNNKNINFDASFDGKAEKFTMKGNSETPEAAMANVAANNAALAAILSKLADQLSALIPAAAKAGAMAGS